MTPDCASYMQFIHHSRLLVIYRHFLVSFNFIYYYSVPQGALYSFEYIDTQMNARCGYILLRYING